MYENSIIENLYYSNIIRRSDDMRYEEWEKQLYGDKLVDYVMAKLPRGTNVLEIENDLNTLLYSAVAAGEQDAFRKGISFTMRLMNEAYMPRMKTNNELEREVAEAI